MKLRLLVLLMLTVAPGGLGTQASPSVVMDTDEPEAVLSILEKRASSEAITESDWAALFESQGYVRLKQREASMRRDFTDQEFQEFVLSDELGANASKLRTALDAWSSVDLEAPRAAAASYLPDDAVIRATIYPVIKPKTNSFVFDVSNNPAIFMYLDPSVSAENLSNTLAHELHHIGFGSGCPRQATRDAIEALPENVGWVVKRLGAFGEGFAMLAAAGGPGVHPQATSSPDDRERWDRDVANAAVDMKRVERFVLDSISGKLAGDERQQTFFSFYGVQGPWYTVGWLMASTIEEQLGRESLLAAFCDTRELLTTYNRAAAVHNSREATRLPLWSPPVLEALKASN